MAEQDRVTPARKNGKAFIPSEFRGVQALRGLAACMVIVFHATGVWVQHVGGPVGIWGNGASGVPVFFVISGFVMTISTAGKKNGPHPARDFMERRLVRIVPLYWLITGLTLLKLFAVHLVPSLENAGSHVTVSFGYIVSSLLFLPQHNSLGIVQPVVLVGWTLFFEMFFYLLFACALALRIKELRLLTPIMIGLAVLGIIHGSFGPAIGILASPLLLEFLAGVVIAQLAQVGYSWRPVVAGVVGAVSLVGLLTVPLNAFFGIDWLTCGTFAVLLVFCVVSLEARIWEKIPRWVLAIGEASYSLYLIHVLLFSFIVKGIMKLGLLSPGATHRTGEIATVLLFAVPSILISLLVYRWIEAPINNTLRYKLRLRNAKMQPVPA